MVGVVTLRRCTLYPCSTPAVSLRRCTRGRPLTARLLYPVPLLHPSSTAHALTSRPLPISSRASLLAPGPWPCHDRVSLAPGPWPI